LGQLVVDRLGLGGAPPELREWREMVSQLKTPHEPVNIALVGNYVELRDAYFSVREALHHAALHHNRDINITWVHAEALERDGAQGLLRSVQGIVVPDSFGVSCLEGMIAAANYARNEQIPYLGLCSGLQVMAIEFARHVLGLNGANSTEFDARTPHPVIDLLPEYKSIDNKDDGMRLGNYPCQLKAGSLAASAYGQRLIYERHRHRYEFNNEYRASVEEAGLICSGQSPDGQLVEVCELADHPWMVSCQFDPQFTSRPGKPNPLFRDFIGVAKNVLREGAQTTLPLPS